jgi:hypothetical protein
VDGIVKRIARDARQQLLEEQLAGMEISRSKRERAGGGKRIEPSIERHQKT